MMHGNVHGSKTAHGQACNATMRRICNCVIPGIDVFDQVGGNIRFDVLALIVAIAPFASLPLATIAIGQNHDQFGNLAKCNECISGLVGLATSEPITISAWSAVQEVECGIASSFSLCCIVGRWQVDQKFLHLSTKCRADYFIMYNSAVCRYMHILESWWQMKADIRRVREQVTSITSKRHQSNERERTQVGREPVSNCPRFFLR